MDVTAHRVDTYVGEKLRELRRSQRMSQGTLGQHLGITFQQVQKYERGTNRMSVSKLYEAAELLGVDIGYFVAGYASGGLATPAKDNSDAEWAMIAKLVQKVAKDQRQKLIEVIKLFVA